MVRAKPTMLSIGALSKATGIPAETLRTWERRYGFPIPERLPSGHRRYRVATVERLRLIARALALGHRPSTVVGESMEALQALLRVTSPAWDDGGQPPESETPAGDRVVEWLDLVQAHDGEEFYRSLRREWEVLGAMRCMSERMRPLLFNVGEAWARGELSVHHEHFASEHVRDFLSSRWRPLSSDSDGRKRVVCATLPGEQHDLGLHMAAVALSISGVPLVFLGANTPLDDIVSAAHGTLTVAIAISVSLSASPAQVGTDLTELRRALHPGIQILAGGAGAIVSIEGVTNISSLRALRHWAEAL